MALVQQITFIDYGAECNSRTRVKYKIILLSEVNKSGTARFKKIKKGGSNEKRRYPR